MSRAAHAVKFWLLHRAARAVVICARAHLRAIDDRERLARLVAGPEADVVPQVLAVERRHAAALKQVGFHGDANPKSQRQHEDEGVAARGVFSGDEHPRDEHARETLEHEATDHADGDRRERRAQFPEDTEKDEPEGAREARGPRAVWKSTSDSGARRSVGGV